MIRVGLFDLYVSDVGASVAFYAGRLGLRETFRTPTEGRPERTASRAPLERRRWRSCCGPTTSTRRTPPGRRRGALGAGAHDSGNGNRNALVRDPDGTLVELVAKTG